MILFLPLIQIETNPNAAKKAVEGFAANDITHFIVTPDYDIQLCTGQVDEKDLRDGSRILNVAAYGDGGLFTATKSVDMNAMPEAVRDFVDATFELISDDTNEFASCDIIGTTETEAFSLYSDGDNKVHLMTIGSIKAVQLNVINDENIWNTRDIDGKVSTLNDEQMMNLLRDDTSVLDNGIELAAGNFVPTNINGVAIWTGQTQLTYKRTDTSFELIGTPETSPDHVVVPVIDTDRKARSTDQYLAVFKDSLSKPLNTTAAYGDNSAMATYLSKGFETIEASPATAK